MALPDSKLVSAEAAVRFSEYFDTAPPLPRPLKSRYPLKFITAGGMQAETSSVAPLTQPELDAALRANPDYVVDDNDDEITRYVRRNLI